MSECIIRIEETTGRGGTSKTAIVACDNCDKHIEKDPSKVNEHNFCNAACFGEWNAVEDTTERPVNCVSCDQSFVNLTGMKTHHAQTHGESLAGFEKECKNCGDTFIAPQQSREYCEQSCVGKDLFHGEDNPSWSGGHYTNYGRNWTQQREKCLERDGYKCRACGMTHSEHKEKYDRGLDVHHVVPLREFNDPVDGNSLANLVTACVACHKRFEGLPVFPE